MTAVPLGFAILGTGIIAEVHRQAIAMNADLGALATLSATSTAPPGFRQRVEVYGTAGAIQLEGDVAIRWESAHGTGPGVAAPAAAAPASPFPTVGSQSPVAHAAFVRDFVEALRDGRTLAVDGLEGRRSVAAVLGIYEAAGLLPRPA